MVYVFDSFEPKQLRLYLYPNQTDHTVYKIWGREFKNKYIATDLSYWYHTAGKIDQRCYVPRGGEKLYFSSSCKMPRDLFRNSGYSITRDPDAADFTVIPDPEIFSYPSWSTCAVLRNLGEIYLLDITKERYETADSSFLHKNADRIRQYLTKQGYEILVARDDFYNFDVRFLPKIQEYKDILLDENNPTHTKDYAIDVKIPVNPPTVISTETLLIWKNLASQSDGLSLLQNAICSSDWKDYPCTLRYFINEFCYLRNENISERFRYVLKKIKYTDNGHHNYALDAELVQPKDWNMLQDFLLALLGVGENGGYVAEGQIGNFALDNFLQKRVAVRPHRISEPMTQGDLQKCMKN